MSDTEFLPLRFAVLTISDSRTAADDKSGAMLKRLTTEAGHQIHEQGIVRDDIYQIRAAVSRWIADPADRGKVLHELNGEIYRRFRDEGIAIPFPQQDLHIKEIPARDVRLEA